MGTKKIELTRNDKLYHINFTIKEPNSVDPFVLTGSTILFKMWNNPHRSQVNDSCEIVDDLNGECRYLLKDGDLSVSGEFDAELEITFPGGERRTIRDLKIIVHDDAPE